MNEFGWSNGERITPEKAGDVSGEGDAVDTVKRGNGSVILLLLLTWGQTEVFMSCLTAWAREWLLLIFPLQQ